jgi:hypothetical protein
MSNDSKIMRKIASYNIMSNDAIKIINNKKRSCKGESSTNTNQCKSSDILCNLNYYGSVKINISLLTYA